MSHRLPPGRFPTPGTYLRRDRDNMLGLVRGEVRLFDRGLGMKVRDVPVWWIDEPGIGYLAAERGAYDVLDNPVERVQLTAEFTAIVCPACKGRGSSAGQVCPEPRCYDGRLLGVRADYDVNVARRSAQRAVRPTAANNDFIPNRELELRYAATCEVCGKTLAAGSRARGGKVRGRWGFKCLEHNDK